MRISRVDGLGVQGVVSSSIKLKYHSVARCLTFRCQFLSPSNRHRLFPVDTRGVLLSHKFQFFLFPAT